MNVTTAMTQINYAFRGSDDDPPTSGTDFNLWLGTLNRKQNEWANDTKRNWSSLYSVDTLTPVVAAGTQTYNLPATFLTPSDRVKVTVGTNVYYYTLIEPQEQADTQNCAYISGSNPKKLTFVDTIATGNQIVGGTIAIGGYHSLADLTAAADTILVDDPYWLVYAVASELAANDITYSDKFPDLNAKANNLYGMMVSNNRRGTFNNPRRASTSVSRILSPSSESGVGTF